MLKVSQPADDCLRLTGLSGVLEKLNKRRHTALSESSNVLKLQQLPLACCKSTIFARQCVICRLRNRREMLKRLGMPAV